MVAALTEAGSLNQYVWSLRYIDAAVLRDENSDSDDLCDDERLYYLANKRCQEP